MTNTMPTAERYQENREYHRQYYHKNKDKIRLYYKLRYPQRKEKIRAQVKTYRDAHKEEFKAYSKWWWKTHPSKLKRKRIIRNLGFYGIIWSQFEDLLINSKSRCQICGKKLWFGSFDKSEVPHIDHNHETLKVRGILCRHCNLFLWQYENCLPQLFSYLEPTKREIGPFFYGKQPS